jgi:hypothetical protein
MVIEPVSAVAGAVGVAVIGSSYYAAYLKGGNDATAPDEIVDLGEVFNHASQTQTLKALRQDVDEADGQ